MHEFADLLLSQASMMPAIEVVAVALAVMYLLLAIRQNIWCWPCALLSTALFAYIFFDVALYMEAALNVFYFAMAIYGWHKWRLGTGDAELPVINWPRNVHVAAIVAILMITSINGYLLDRFTDAAFPYVDSLTSWAAVWATFLVARKVLENWWYWLVINATMVYVFWIKQLELTAVLYIVYIVLIPIGLVAWTRSQQARSQ